MLTLPTLVRARADGRTGFYYSRGNFGCRRKTVSAHRPNFTLTTSRPTRALAKNTDQLNDFQAYSLKDYLHRRFFLLQGQNAVG